MPRSRRWGHRERVLVLFAGSGGLGRPGSLGTNLGQLHSKRLQLRRTTRADHSGTARWHGRNAGSRSWTRRAARIRAKTLRQVRPGHQPEDGCAEGHRPRSVDRACPGRAQRRRDVLRAQRPQRLVLRRPPALCGRATAMRVLVVVEDDPDVQFLIETVFSEDDRLSVAVLTASAENALEVARTTEPGVIVLDHGLAGPLTDRPGSGSATQGGGPERQDHPLPVSYTHLRAHE